MPRLPHPHSLHLCRSRHGIWYVRYVVPSDIRAQHPHLPKEIRRSTGTSVIRLAKRLARDFLGQFVRGLAATGLDMPNSNDDRLDNILKGLMPGGSVSRQRAAGHPQVSPMVIDVDPKTGGITRIESQPHDSPQAIEMITRLLREQRDTTSAALAAGQIGIAATPRSPAVGINIMPTQQPLPNGRWLSEATANYLEQLLKKGKHNAQTLTYAHEPSLRIFRELISDKRRLFGDPGQAGTWDIRINLLTPDHMDRFIADLWNLPAQQGKRPEANDAKSVLATGGPKQSRGNVVKRLRHVLPLVEWLNKRSELHKDVLGRLQSSLNGIVNERVVEAAQPLDFDEESDGEDEGGYIAFSAADLQRLFHPAVYEAHAAGDAARYWIPLLGRYTGCRLNEIAQAGVRDVRKLGEIPCLCITSIEKDANGNIVPLAQRRKRLKTKAGRRSIPLHPELLRLGFTEYAEDRHKEGKALLFDLPWFKKDAYGKYPGRDFRRLSEAVGVWEKKRRVFHSFRATISQQLDVAGLDSTLVDRFLGHRVNTVRARHYGRNREGISMPLQRVLEALGKIPADTPVPTWPETRKARGRQLKKLCIELCLAPVDGEEPPGV